MGFAKLGDGCGKLPGLVVLNGVPHKSVHMGTVGQRYLFLGATLEDRTIGQAADDHSAQKLPEIPHRETMSSSHV